MFCRFLLIVILTNINTRRASIGKTPPRRPSPSKAKNSPKKPAAKSKIHHNNDNGSDDSEEDMFENLTPKELKVNNNKY